ncbi:hypothetical protein, partial [Vibrio sp. F13]|uniref:hypothetical protein n=2 Tax=Vibrio TaxID=662 RepID=UPI0010BDB654
MKKLKVSAAVFTAALVSTPCLSMEWNTEFSKMMNEQLQQYVGVSVNEYTVIQSASMTHNSFNNTLVKRSSYRVSLPSSDYDLSALKSSVKES